MAVLARLALASVAFASAAGCYDPPVRDCTVTCHGAGECASGQVCGADGFCAAPSVAGTCAHEVADAADVDAAREDGRPDSAFDAAPPDAPGAQLHVTISGKGKVVDSTSTLTCVAPPGDCLFGAEPGATITLTAVGSGGHAFVDWSTANCTGMGATCTVTIVAPVTTVSATFN